MKKNYAKNWSLLLILFLFGCHALFAQDFLATTKVRLTIEAEPLPKALDQLGEVAGIDLSYSSDLIPLDKQVTVSFEGQSLQTVLDTLLAATPLRYKVLHGLLVIYREKNANPPKAGHVLSGIVRDAETGKPVVDAVLFDQYLGIKSSTNQQGAFQLMVPNPDYVLHLQMESAGYQSKMLRLRLDEDRWMNVVATPEGRTVSPKPPANLATNDTFPTKLQPIYFEKAIPERPSPLLKPFRSIKFVKIVWPELPKINLKTETAEGLTLKPMQITFFHPLGTNLQNAGSTINRFSLNLLAGYAAGVQGLEVGGLANVTKFNMEGVQIGGIVNLVGGTATGFQVGGITNTARLRTVGGQIAGINNFSGLDLRGIQVSGVNNSVRGEMVGAQVAGFNNVITKNGEGLQLAGFANTTVGLFRGAQVSGFANVNWGRLHGWQLSGFTNLAGDVKGVQMAGFFNRARVLNGLQIGLFNLADSVGKGGAIGLLSMVLKGYRRLEVSVDELGLVNLNFKTGIERFYNILSVGGWSNVDEWGWQFGYGVGSQFLAGNHFSLNADLSTHYLNEREFWAGQFNLLNKLSLQVAYRPGKRFSFFAGPTLVYQLSQLENSEGNLIPPTLSGGWSLEQRLEGQTYHTVRLGFLAGVRF